MPKITREPYPHLGKFKGGDSVTVWFYEEGYPDEETGDVQWAYGWYGFYDVSEDPLIVEEEDGDETIVVAAIGHEDTQGFYDITEFEDIEEAQQAWAEVVAELEGAEEEGAMDVITSERDSIVSDMEDMFSRHPKMSADVLADRYGSQMEFSTYIDTVREALEEIAEEVVGE